MCLLKPGQLVETERQYITKISSATIASLVSAKWSPELLTRIIESGRLDKNYQAKVTTAKADKPPKDVTLNNNLLYYQHCLWIPNDNELKQWIAKAKHDSKVAGHFGQGKTVQLIPRNFYWPKMDQWVIDYV
jgi:hypothetical protein